jgi:hypothetical protein
MEIAAVVEAAAGLGMADASYCSDFALVCMAPPTGIGPRLPD